MAAEDELRECLQIAMAQWLAWHEDRHLDHPRDHGGRTAEQWERCAAALVPRHVEVELRTETAQDDVTAALLGRRIAEIKWEGGRSGESIQLVLDDGQRIDCGAGVCVWPAGA